MGTEWATASRYDKNGSHIDGSRSALYGLAFALLPGMAPFIAIVLRGGRLRWRRGDLLFGVAALCWAAPLLSTGPVSHAAAAVAQIAAVALLVAIHRDLRIAPRHFALGVTVGLAVHSFVTASQVMFGYVDRASGWTAHPNLFAHQTLVVTAAAILVARSRGSLALPLAAVGALALAASRAALVGWLALALLVAVRSRADVRRAVTIMLSGVLLVLLASLALSGRLVDLAGLRPEPKRNLVTQSERPEGSSWDALGVRVARSDVASPVEGARPYAVEKLAPAPWSRLQQPLRIEPGVPYVASVWLLTDELRAGFQGAGSNGTDRLVVIGEMTPNGWQARVEGAGDLMGAGATGEGRWRRTWIAFRFNGDESLASWMFGPAPDQRHGVGGKAVFAGVQLERGANPSPYEATLGTGRAEGTASSRARADYLALSLDGIPNHPWLGHGLGSFPRYVRRAAPDVAVPAHAHNLFLQVAFERGLVGLVGLTLLLLALACAPRRKEWGALGLLALVLALNLVDYTLLYSGVLYPLASAIGLIAGPSIRARSGLTASQPSRSF